MSTPIKTCPNCRLRADIGSKMHDCKAADCTWWVCDSCKTTYDRYTGSYPKVAA